MNIEKIYSKLNENIRLTFAIVNNQNNKKRIAHLRAYEKIEYIL